MSPPRLLPRHVTLVLLAGGDGSPLGVLPEFEVASPWWPEVGPIVGAVRARFDREVTVLRLLRAADSWPGGQLTYVAELNGDQPPDGLPLAAWDGPPDALADHPLRMDWARPAGPAGDLAWARKVLLDREVSPPGRPEQVRSWNLSSLWRLPLPAESAWLKVVPPFFEHEGRLLERLQGGRVPRLIAHDGRRMLLHEIPGDDLHEATIEQLLRMVEQLVELQVGWIGRTDELLAQGLPDWRGPALAAAIHDVIERAAWPLPVTERAALDSFSEGLETRLGAVAECAMPDTLVHGDFHPGNHRGRGLEFVLLDWGDSGVGNPLLDEPAFLARVPADDLARVRRHWQSLWRRAVPGSEPERAATLLGPVAAARQAVIYQKFLDNIEPSEQPYHRDDPADWLRRTAELLGAEDQVG